MAGSPFGTGWTVWTVWTRVESGENDSCGPETEGADCGVDRGGPFDSPLHPRPALVH